MPDAHLIMMGFSSYCDPGDITPNYSRESWDMSKRKMEPERDYVDSYPEPSSVQENALMVPWRESRLEDGCRSWGMTGKNIWV